MIRIEVPGNPVAKARPRVTTINGRAHAYTPAKTVNYGTAVAYAGKEAMVGKPPLEGPVRVMMFAYFMPPKRTTKAFREALESGRAYHTGRPDFDNIAKAAIDPLNGIVWRDDSQVAFAMVTKLYANKPRLVIEVREL